VLTSADGAADVQGGPRTLRRLADAAQDLRQDHRSTMFGEPRLHQRLALALKQVCGSIVGQHGALSHSASSVVRPFDKAGCPNAITLSDRLEER
jgi:hypothetical protein